MDQTGIAPATNWPGSGGSMRSISWWVDPDVTAYLRQEAADPDADRDHDAVEPGSFAAGQGYADAPGPLLHARDGGFLANDYALFPGQAAHEGDGAGALDVSGPGVDDAKLVVGEAELGEAVAGLGRIQHAYVRAAATQEIDAWLAWTSRAPCCRVCMRLQPCGRSECRTAPPTGSTVPRRAPPARRRSRCRRRTRCGGFPWRRRWSWRPRRAPRPGRIG